MLDKIDIIIPAYNAHKTMDRCLTSIICQTTKEDIAVTIVNDASTDGNYSEFVKRYKDVLNIKEIGYKKNMGPGYARQYGIDNTTGALFTCIDADDTFAGAYAIEMLRKGLENPSFHTCIGAFVEERENLQFVLHNQDLVWMFGKMYRRAFWDRYKVRFHPVSRANEDNGVNTILRLVSSEQEQINFIPDTVYYWHVNVNSITRINNCQYSYDQSFCGYTENMIYAIRHAKKMKPYNGMITQWAVQTMCQLYAYWMEGKVRDPRFVDQNWEWCKRYYSEIYQPMRNDITSDTLGEMYSVVMTNAVQSMIGVAPDMTIFQFIDKLEAEYQDINAELLGKEYEGYGEGKGDVINDQI